MQIVIDMPEETYNDIQSSDWKNGELIFSEEWKAIHNGIPLPKGHGGLVDEKTETFIEPCDDAISRQAVLDAIHEADMNAYDECSMIRDLTRAINELQPVTPQPKTVHWISVSELIKSIEIQGRK